MQEKSITTVTKNGMILLEDNLMMYTTSVKDKCSLELAILRVNALNKGDGPGYTLLQRQTLLTIPKSKQSFYTQKGHRPKREPL